MRILVAIDESSYSRAAFDLVKARTWPGNSEFRLIRVINPVEDFVATWSGEVLAHEPEHERMKALQLLSTLNGELSQARTGMVLPPVIAAGNAREKIVEAAAGWHADLIVMGSHGRTGFRLALLGSVSQGVLEHAPCPVLIVKHVEPDSARDFRRILVAVDGSEFSQFALSWLNEQPWAEGASFCFATVALGLPADFYDEMDIQRAAALLEGHASVKLAEEQGMREAVARWAPALVARDHSFSVLEGDAPKAIVDLAAELESDLIVLGSQGLSALGRLILGSVSGSVSIHALCSVLVVRRKDEPDHPVSDVGGAAAELMFESDPERRQRPADIGSVHVPPSGL